MADPYKDKVVLFLPMEGSHNGSTVFNDRTGKTVTVNGNTNLSTAVIPPWGKTSAYFDGNLDYLQFAHDTSWGIGDGDFTVEFWLRVVSWGVSGYVKNVVGTYSYGTTEGGTLNDGWQLGYEYSTGTLYFGYGLGAAWTSVANISGAVVLDTWAHFAVTRQGSTVRMFKDGVIAATATDGTNFNRPKTKLNVGCRNDSGTYREGATLYGYIKDLRITKGVARYTGNFSVSQNTKLDDQYWSNTVLAIHGEGTGTTFTDVSNSAKTITTVGNTTHSTAVAPPFGTSSIYFDGSVDYLTLADSTDFEFGSGNFTIETWVRFSTYFGLYSGYYLASLINKHTSSSNREFSITFKGTISSITDVSVSISANGTAWDFCDFNVLHSFQLNTWYHVAICRTGTQILVFVNGVIKGSAVVSGAINASTAGLRIGAFPDSGWEGYLPGYIKDLRITKGVARYTQNFNPWKVQDQYYKDSVLLISGEGSGTTFTDVSNNESTFTTTGNTTHSTAVAPPFGTSSIYFDGSGDYLTRNGGAVANSLVLGDLTVPWTIEFWANVTGRYSAGQYPVPLDIAVSGTDRHTVFALGDGSTLRFVFHERVSNAGGYVWGDYISPNSWHHHAFVCVGNKTVLSFTDGVLVESYTWTSTISNASNVYVRVGNLYSGTDNFQGYIKDLRIIKGVAKYTSDFTPVKSPAQTKSNGIPVTFPDKTGIKTIVKPLQWNEPEQDRIMI